MAILTGAARPQDDSARDAAPYVLYLLRFLKKHPAFF